MYIILNFRENVRIKMQFKLSQLCYVDMTVLTRDILSNVMCSCYIHTNKVDLNPRNSFVRKF